MHRRITGAAAIALAVGSGLAFTALPASAHEDCWDVTFSDSRLSDPGTPRTPSVPWGMQGGVGIRVGQAVSKDSASGRASGPAQPSERWEVEFLDAAGNVVGRSGVTDDLPDDTDDAMWSGEIAGAFVQNDVVAIRAHHRPDLGAAGTDNGVDAVSVQLCVETSATTTTATSTHDHLHGAQPHEHDDGCAGHQHHDDGCAGHQHHDDGRNRVDHEHHEHHGRQDDHHDQGHRGRHDPVEVERVEACDDRRVHRLDGAARRDVAGRRSDRTPPASTPGLTTRFRVSSSPTHHRGFAEPVSAKPR